MFHNRKGYIVGCCGGGIRIKKCKYTDSRIRICQTCERNNWQGQMLKCGITKEFIPHVARKEENKCPLKKWQILVKG